MRWNDRAGGEERRAARNEDQRRSSRGLEMEAQRRVRVTEMSRDETEKGEMKHEEKTVRQGEKLRHKKKKEKKGAHKTRNRELEIQKK